MNFTYYVLSSNNHSDVNGSTLTVNIGNKVASPGIGMPAFTFTVSNPTSADLTTYAIGNAFTLTVAPATVSSAG